MNESTLDCTKAVDIALEKATGCLHQITTREVKRFATTLLSLDEKVTILMQEIRNMLGHIDTILIHANLTMSDGTICTETTQLHKHVTNIGQAVFI